MVNDPNSISTVGAWSMNVFSSVAIIMVNKQVMSGFNFRFATTLTGLHFVMTAIVGVISSRVGYLSSDKKLPFFELLWFSLVANASVVCMNISLMLNSVGFYQISKLSIIPTVCVLEAILHGKKYSREVKLAVVVVMLGVGVCTVTDINMNLSGTITAFIAVISTSLQQIFIGALQKKHAIGSFDLLSQTAPIQAASLVLLGPIVDYFITSLNVLAFDWAIYAELFILLSCVLAVLCNLSQYLCIGKFSATTFQVLGHMKTVLVLVLGWLLFDSRITLKNVGGMGMAIVGMVLYSWAVEKAKAEEAVVKAPLMAASVGSKQGSGDEAAVPLVANVETNVSRV
eukprot:TRINITY_DN5132_c0_g1_i1.p1 TRINITY_DN5132_c0_g1~~TRINITY_DN5132_c0_g1_i1.p1  ORF type:complete len:342 (-),score=55.26 TRINITY_DN5132_c0_g1_i1:195-1220(-)